MVPKTSKVANPLCSIYSSAHNTHEEPNPLICRQTHVPTYPSPSRLLIWSSPSPLGHLQRLHKQPLVPGRSLSQGLNLIRQPAHLDLPRISLVSQHLQAGKRDVVHLGLAALQHFATNAILRWLFRGRGGTFGCGSGIGLGLAGSQFGGFLWGGGECLPFLGSRMGEHVDCLRWRSCGGRRLVKSWRALVTAVRHGCRREVARVGGSVARGGCA